MYFIKIMTAIVLVAAISACGSQEGDYKAERQKVIEYHDIVMADHGKVVGNQRKIQALLNDLKSLKASHPMLDTIKEKDSMDLILQHLLDAEESMNDWMHEFQADITGKSNAEAIRYFQAEQRKVAKIDSLFKMHLKNSDAYLSRFGK
ncbi:hypothetical protein [Pedobacter deserti]|uniref:hypothetical protein n=1 Tax=Pedobacter deserti TaxID=2817382 RepID=UPI0021090C80|nr:hypothetical protein [Pedobacter sp. SYSU D00382]